MQNLMPPAAAEALDTLLMDDCFLVGGSSDEYSSISSVAHQAVPAPASVQYVEDFGHKQPNAAGNAASYSARSSSTAVSRLPSLDVTDWPCVDMQDLLQLSDAELMASYSLDDTLLVDLGAAPVSELLPASQLPTSGSPEHGLSPLDAAAVTEVARSLCQRPLQPTSGATCANCLSMPHQLTPAPAFGSCSVLACPTSSPCTPVSMPPSTDRQQLAGPATSDGSEADAECAAASNGTATQRPGRSTRSGRKRRNAPRADTDPPKQLEEYEKKQALKQEQNRRNQEACRARKRVQPFSNSFVFKSVACQSTELWSVRSVLVWCLETFFACLTDLRFSNMDAATTGRGPGPGDHSAQHDLPAARRLEESG